MQFLILKERTVQKTSRLLPILSVAVERNITSMILEQDLRELQTLFAEMGLDQADQHMSWPYSCLFQPLYTLYSTKQLPGGSLASVEVSLTLLEEFGKDRYADR
jgi:hypothetical protein